MSLRDPSASRPKNSKGDLTRLLNTRLRFGRSLTVALFLICLMGHVLAQGNTADLQGIVTDPSGATVSGARVTLENPAVGLVRETTSRERPASTAFCLSLRPDTRFEWTPRVFGVGLFQTFF